MPFIMVVANVAVEGLWEKTQKNVIYFSPETHSYIFLHSFDVTWVLSYMEFLNLESKMADEWSMKNLIDSAIGEVNQHLHCQISYRE